MYKAFLLPGILLFGFSAVASAQVAAAVQGVGAIAGITVDATTGKPLAGVILTARRSGLPPLSVNVVSDKAGGYMLPALPEGSYTICAQYPGDGYLDPCQWNVLQPEVKLAAAQQLAGNQVKMIPGSVLHIKVNDPGHLLNKKSQAGLVGDISAGVMGAKGFHPAHVVHTDANGADYQVTIPRDTRVGVHVTSQHLKLADAKGADLPGNFLQQTFQHKTADTNPQSFTIAIVGVKQ